METLDAAQKNSSKSLWKLHMQQLQNLSEMTYSDKFAEKKLPILLENLDFSRCFALHLCSGMLIQLF